MLLSSFMKNENTTQKTNFDRFNNISEMKVIDLGGTIGSGKKQSNFLERFLILGEAITPKSNQNKVSGLFYLFFWS